MQVVENFKRLQAETEPVLKIFEDPEVTRQIQQSRDSKQLLEFLVTNFSFKPEMIDTCYNFAKVPWCIFISVAEPEFFALGDRNRNYLRLRFCLRNRN